MITRKHTLEPSTKPIVSRILPLQSAGLEPVTSFNSEPLDGGKDRLREGIESGGEPFELTHIQMASQTQYAMPQRISPPLMSEAGRGLETSATTETSTPSPTPESTTPSHVLERSEGMDINRIAEEVYDIIERRLRGEKERRGYF